MLTLENVLLMACSVRGGAAAAARRDAPAPCTAASVRDQTGRRRTAAAAGRRCRPLYGRFGRSKRGHHPAAHAHAAMKRRPRLSRPAAPSPARVSGRGRGAALGGAAGAGTARAHTEAAPGPRVGGTRATPRRACEPRSTSSVVEHHEPGRIADGVRRLAALAGARAQHPAPDVRSRRRSAQLRLRAPLPPVARPEQPRPRAARRRPRSPQTSCLRWRSSAPCRCRTTRERLRCAHPARTPPVSSHTRTFASARGREALAPAREQPRCPRAPAPVHNPAMSLLVLPCAPLASALPPRFSQPSTSRSRAVRH